MKIKLNIKIKKFAPRMLIAICARLLKLLAYRDDDSSEYWKKRSSEDGEKAVLWSNQGYNRLYRELQKEILLGYVTEIRTGGRILDIGAGIGVVSNMICQMNDSVFIDAVDFDEMINIAQANVAWPQVNFMRSSAESFLQESYKYDLILSSACYSQIRDIASLEQSLSNAVLMLADGGILLMIDPFHRWNYLARAKYGSTNVIDYLTKKGLTLLEKSGLLFWPFRDWLAGSNIHGKTLERRFRLGERILKVAGSHFWGDYKVLIFRK